MWTAKSTAHAMTQKLPSLKPRSVIDKTASEPRASIAPMRTCGLSLCRRNIQAMSGVRMT
jgi:hypothetical protein